MAEKRIRDGVESIEDTNTIITPETKQEQPNQYDTILQMFEENNKRLAQLEQENKELVKKVAEANWDISEQVKKSKRKYWYEIDWVTRKTDELFSFRYNCLINENKEKVIIKVETIWRPVNTFNSNTGKWNNIHNLKITFHDKTTTELDILDYINQKFQYEDFVNDEDIVKKDGVKFYTFNTKKFWKFTVAQNFIN